VGGAVARQQRTEVDVDDDLAIHHQERRVAEQRQGAADAATGAEQVRFARVHDVCAQRRAVAELALDHLAVVEQVHHDVAHAVADQVRDGVTNQRDVGHRQERLGPLRRQRAEPRAHAGSEDHRARARRHCAHELTAAHSARSITTKCRSSTAPAVRS
jgi:hypothetical protein